MLNMMIYVMRWSGVVSLSFFIMKVKISKNN